MINKKDSPGTGEDRGEAWSARQGQTHENQIAQPALMVKGSLESHSGKNVHEKPTIEEITAAVEARIAEVEGNRPLQGGEVALRPLQAVPESAERFLRDHPPAFDWLLRQSLRRSCLGVIAGPPGAGKGTLALQLCSSIAACSTALNIWDVTCSGLSLYLSAEDDMSVIHRRLHHALRLLPHEKQHDAASRIFALSVSGCVNLCRNDRNIGLHKTQNFSDLRNMIGMIRPEIVVLDTLSRFSGIEENDNPSMTSFCGFLEELIAEFQCNVIVIHHTNKGAADCIDNEQSLGLALSQTAVRGASALLGCVRWALVLAPLSAKLAVKLVGEDAEGKPDSSFVAVRVSKKNSGSPESRHFLARGEHGLLHRVNPSLQGRGAGDALSDAQLLADKIRELHKTGMDLPSVSQAGEKLFSWGYPRSVRAVENALALGLLEKIGKTKGSGQILAPLPQFPNSPFQAGN
jgi:hypothetical protein